MASTVDQRTNRLPKRMRQAWAKIRTQADSLAERVAHLASSTGRQADRSSSHSRQAVDNTLLALVMASSVILNCSINGLSCSSSIVRLITSFQFVRASSQASSSLSPAILSCPAPSVRPPYFIAMTFVSTAKFRGILFHPKQRQRKVNRTKQDSYRFFAEMEPNGIELN